ncbi:hypothetical protein EDEG_01533 [Edhazardia aedis USNM 41457]|uniref:Uncharacterized protein n=1 Tax=Edhazardia aedis (strain USNM 41457) TaxID=1003232 RepID=J8ZWY5_EDHAE|nr:hypothetical protein EDEG_01533 [Edhazardia aedis USNM 41457]|eukprot:EJW04183.1 hypothetical protein EDEG_01533 [Edhazardia aedis USNM 41457]
MDISSLRNTFISIFKKNDNRRTEQQNVELGILVADNPGEGTSRTRDNASIHLKLQNFLASLDNNNTNERLNEFEEILKKEAENREYTEKRKETTKKTNKCILTVSKCFLIIVFLLYLVSIFLYSNNKKSIGTKLTKIISEGLFNRG